MNAPVNDQQELDSTEDTPQPKTDDSNSTSIESQPNSSVSQADKALETPAPDGANSPTTELDLVQNGKKKRRRKRRRRTDATEQRLLGRRAMCKDVEAIAPSMMKTVKMRVLARHLDSKRGMADAELTERIRSDASQLVGKDQVLESTNAIDSDVHRRNLKDILLYVILLQEETYSLEEGKLEERVLEYETNLVAKAGNLDIFDGKQHDPQRAHNCDTYRVVLDAAWRNNDDISLDEAELLKVLRVRLDISGEEHRMISAHISRFPKRDCELHTRDEIHDARKELQRDGLLWSYRDDNNRSVDVIPREVAEVLRTCVVQMELQRTNYIRLLQHDCLNLTDLRSVLVKHSMDRNGNKQELIDRIAGSDIAPREVLDSLDRSKLADMCRLVGLASSGRKDEVCLRLVQFYDDLSFEERETQDEREEWYNNYELLAARAYADLRAKKLISKDLEVEHQFEKATDFLFEQMLNVGIDNTRKITKADGRIPVGDRQVILWDCKSAEKEVNLQDHLDDQFDGYLRKERQKGFEPLAFIVVGPSFSANSIKIAHQYKAKTNWDIALVHADALKHIAEHWAAQETEQTFPIGLFNRTELIDLKLAEFLISLA
ncbi:MAG: hypothetical protein ABGZ53_03045 [Fuerstiella sp.]